MLCTVVVFQAGGALLRLCCGNAFPKMSPPRNVRGGGYVTQVSTCWRCMDVEWACAVGLAAGCECMALDSLGL